MTKNARDLNEAIRRARIVEADRTDVVVELRASERARLDLLNDELRPVFEQAAKYDQFECAIVPGDPPRLWIDMLSYVVMGADKRTYRFVKDMRDKRRVLHETHDTGDMADKVTDYLAHRIIEREQALAGDEDRPAARARATAAPLPAGYRGLSVFLAFALGLLAGIAGLFVYGAYFAGG